MPILWEYALAVFVVAICSIVSFAIFSKFALINLVMIYLLGTLVVASRGHRGPAALSSLLGVACFDFFFVPPRFSFTVSDAEYIFTFAVMFATAMIISQLTIRLRSEANAAREGERQTALMHEFSQGLTRARSARDVFEAAAPKLEQTFHCSVTAFAPRFDLPPVLGEKELGVATWVYDKGEPAGLGASALPSEPALYVPIRGTNGTLGVLRIEPTSRAALSAPQRQLLDAFGHQMALALEANVATVEAETERLRSSLLSSVSHDFRTPLTAIVGSAGALLERDEIKKNPRVSELIETIQDEGERLSRQIQNLLEATRLESGPVQIRKELYPLEDVIGSALERLAKNLKDRPVRTAIDKDLPPVPMDGLLMEQVLVNLIENALRHTAPKTEISLSAARDGEFVEVTVSDRGPGLKDDELERVFEKFYHQKSSTGAGLGLAICRGIVNAHGGKIWAANAPGGGAAFHFTLPLRTLHG